MLDLRRVATVNDYSNRGWLEWFDNNVTQKATMYWNAPSLSNSYHQRPGSLIAFLLGGPYEPSLATVTGKGEHTNLYI